MSAVSTIQNVAVKRLNKPCRFSGRGFCSPIASSSEEFIVAT